MGQVPSKYMMPSAPYGQSDAVNSVNAVQPAAVNPQTPLLPPNFTDPGTTVTGASSPTIPNLGGNQPPRNPFMGGYPGQYGGPSSPLRGPYSYLNPYLR